jgi:uncharacterized protein YndB with AHSA1/START domain
MIELHHEILIHAPVDAVWEALANLESVQHYNPMVASARYLSAARHGVGAARVCEFRGGGAARERVTGWTPNRAIAMEAYEHPWPVGAVRWSNQLTAEGGATRLVQDLACEADGASAEAMKAQWDQGLRAVLAGLKAFVERNHQPTG